MTVCPWCQADLPSPNALCRVCGKRKTDPPSGGPSAQQRVLRKPTGTGEVPDLELSTRSPTGKSGKGPSSSRPPSKPPSFSLGQSDNPAMAGGVGGAVFDEDDIFAPGGGSASALELADIRVAPSGSLAAAMPPAGLGPVPRSAPAERFPRSGRAPRMEPTAEEAEAIALADYGDSPRTWWQAPLYAYRVRTRQSEIRRQLAERHRDLTRARDACDEAKIAFAERARTVAEKSDIFAKLLEPIVTTERVMLERDTALSADMEAHKGRLRVIDERIAQLEAELAEAKSDERQIEDKLSEAEAVRQRAEARVKRAEIEIRNAGARADAEGGGRIAAKGAGIVS